jgi:hypothetical protein
MPTAQLVTGVDFIGVPTRDRRLIPAPAPTDLLG